MLQQFTRFCGSNARVNQHTRSAFNRQSFGLCRGCGQNWTLTHRHLCPALGKKCNHWGLLNHFSKVCRKKKQNNSKNPQENKRINNVKNLENTEQSDNQNVNFINYNEQFYSEYDSSADNYIAMIEHINQIPIAMQNLTITIGNTDCYLLLDSDSGCTIINISLARQIKFDCIQTQWSEKKLLELNCFF